jgi:MFS transporter, DHA3 family, tetracycline resistance protein
LQVSSEHIRKFDAFRYYIFIETASSLLYFLAFTATSLYEIQVAGLSPLQLVLVGTALELTVLLCEVPTGIVADVYSRRLSIIIGFGIVGLGFLLEGLFPRFTVILLAQFIWGLGYTFTSGSRQAWLSDEIGEQRANQAFLSANKFSLAGSLAGMLLAILIGSSHVNLPIVASGGLFILLAGILSLSMAEHGFRPAARDQRNSFQQMIQTFRFGIRTIRQHPRLIVILGMGLFFGLYSEGFDRLWVKHLLGRFTLPLVFGKNAIAFFGLLEASATLLAIAATALVEKRLDTSRPALIGRWMFGITTGIAASIFLFAWSPFLGLAIGIYLVLWPLRNLVGPLTDAWVNQRLPADVRATILSMTGQVDAVGQITGGPLIGLVASLFSVQTAMLTSGLLLTPALPMIAAADRHPPDLSENEPVSIPGGEI